MRVHVRNEVRMSDLNDKARGEKWDLCFQLCHYLGDGEGYEGYRFIWRKPGGNLQAARGQARLQSISCAKILMDEAINQGWGSHDFD